MESFAITVNGFKPLTLLQNSPSEMLVGAAVTFELDYNVLKVATINPLF